MYENDDYKVQINWKSLLLKLALVVIAVLLIIWLFPTPKLDTFYNRIYNENLNNMKSVAEKYFTKDKLPQETGSTTTIKLQDMLDKKIITSFVDKNNNSCNTTNSFAQVTKTDNTNYVLKVQLACDEKTDYVLENIDTLPATVNVTCNNNSSSCNSKEATATTEDDDDLDVKGGAYDKDSKSYEYQYKRAVTKTKSSYRCPDGYVKDGNMCSKYETGETIPATPLYFEDVTTTIPAKVNRTGEYTITAEPTKNLERQDKVCPDGYTLSGDICYTYKNATVIPGSTSYSCTEGTLNGDKCVIEKSATKRTTKGDTYYTCDKGGTLNGTKCTITETKDKTCTKSSDEYYCPNGGTLNGKKCVYNATYKEGTSTCKCPSGYTDNGSNCKKTTTSSYAATDSSYWSNPSIQTSSTPLNEYDNGETKRVLANKNCTLRGCTYTYNVYTKVHKYSCPNGGTLNGATCVKSDTSYANKDCNKSGGSYSCPNGGTLDGTKCKYNASKNNGKETCKCPDGYTSSNGKCTKKTTYNATKHTSSGTEYYCQDSSYELVGSGANSKCRKTVDARKDTTETKYTCEPGYVKQGTTCYKYVDYKVEYTYSYSCPADYIKVGSGENTKCTKTIASTETYYCEDASETLVGDKCTKVVKGALKGYSCPPNYILNNDLCIKRSLECIEPEEVIDTYTTYEYKWSTEESLEGWTRTGKTKEIATDVDSYRK